MRAYKNKAGKLIFAKGRDKLTPGDYWVRLMNVYYVMGCEKEEADYQGSAGAKHQYYRFINPAARELYKSGKRCDHTNSKESVTSYEDLKMLHEMMPYIEEEDRSDWTKWLIEMFGEKEKPREEIVVKEDAIDAIDHVLEEVVEEGGDE
jgi:hypothetical protein